jgi:hypothetical protein
MSVTDSTSGVVFATLSEAILGSAAGDVLRLSPGSYVENFPNITHSLSLISPDGWAYLRNPQPDPPNTRAILNVPGNLNVSLTVSGLDISGANNDISHPASIGGSNGAAILFESGNGALVIQNSHIHHNQDGILVGAVTSASLNGMTVLVTGSEFDHNGLPASNPRYGYDHNIYVNGATSFTLTGSYIHDGLGGNEVKSRALSSTITNNRIFDLQGPASYQIDLPNGGNNLVTGNILEKGVNSPQGRFVSFGTEGTYAGSTLLLQDNIFINHSTLLGNAAIALYNATLDPVTGQIANAAILNNTLYDVPQLYQDRYGPPYDTVSGNVQLAIGLAPALDTTSPTGFPVPEPAGLGALLLIGTVLARRRRRRAALPCRPAPATRVG